MRLPTGTSLESFQLLTAWTLGLLLVAPFPVNVDHHLVAVDPRPVDVDQPAAVDCPDSVLAVEPLVAAVAEPPPAETPEAEFPPAEPHAL